MSLDFLASCKADVFANITAVISSNTEIASAMRYSAIAESKCIRAGLVYASSKLSNDLSQGGSTDLATSIELMHTYSLIHDDLPAMDDDEIRRGQASNHIKFSEATAILAGDALQALAYELIVSSSNLENEHKIGSMKILTSACGYEGMILGQQYDLEAENNNFDDIKKIHTLKTARLIQAALTMPHATKETDSELLLNLDSIGEKLGLAFQIMDDVLEVTSSSEIIGKSNRSDIENKKMTYVTQFGVDQSTQQAQDLVDACISSLQTLNHNERANNLIDLAKFMISRES